MCVTNPYLFLPCEVQAEGFLYGALPFSLYYIKDT